MSITFRGTYRDLGSFSASGGHPAAVGTVTITPAGGSATEETLDSAGKYEVELASFSGKVTVVEDITGLDDEITTVYEVIDRTTTDTSKDIHIPTGAGDLPPGAYATPAYVNSAISALSGTYVPSTGASSKSGVMTFVDKLRRKAGPTVDVQAWIPDGTADDADVTSYVNLAAAAAAGGKLLLTARTAHYAVSTQISVSANTEVEAEDGAVVDLITPNTAGQTYIFRALGDNVTFRNIQVDGSLLTGNLTIANRYIFAATGASAGSPIRRPKVINCRIDNVTQSDGNPVSTNLLVWHGIYFSFTSKAVIEGCEMSDVSGHGCYLAGNHKIKVLHSEFENTGWGGVTLHDSNNVYEVAHCRFTGSAANARNWAAGIDDMSQSSPYVAPNKNGHIHENYFTGVYSYGAALRIAGSHVSVHHNIYDQCVVQNAASPSFLANNVIFVLARATGPTSFTANTTDGSAVIANVSGVASKTAGHSYVTDFPTAGIATAIVSVDVGAGTITVATPATSTATGATFGFASYQEPASHVDIHDETIIAGGASQRGVTISGRSTFGTGDVNLPLTDIRVHDNTFVSVDSSNYLSMALYVNGQGSGVVDPMFDRNKATVHPETTALPGTGSPIPGAVGVLGTSTAAIQRFRARQNTIAYFDTGGGVATTVVQVGVYLGAYTGGSEVRSNTLSAFYDAIYGALNSGAHNGLYDNLGLSSARADLTLDSGVTVAVDKRGHLGVITLGDPLGTSPVLTFAPTSLVVSSRATGHVPLIIRGFSAGQSVDLWRVQSHDGATTFYRIDFQGYLYNKRTSNPSDASFLNSEGTWAWDNTVGGAGPLFKGKDSAGTVYTFDLSRGAALADTSGATLVALEAEVNALKARLRTAGLLAP